MLLRMLPAFAVLAGLTLVYYGAGRLGLSMAMVNPSATAVWPTTGIALAALLVLGLRVWPAILIGAFLVNFTTSGSVVASLGIAVGNTLEGVVGAYLVIRFARGTRAFERPADTFAFAVLAGLIATAISATFGVTTLVLAELAAWPTYPEVWLTWWLGDAAGALVVGPALILWSTDYRLRWNEARMVELCLLTSLLVLVALATFGGLSPMSLTNSPLEFVVVPLVVWAAYRFGQREAASVTLVLSGIAVWGTIQGYGPFVRDSRNESLLLLQAFTGVVAMTGLTVAAIASERARVEQALREANDKMRAGLDHMEQQHVEMAAFSDMSQMLQGCHSLGEATAVLSQFAPRLFRMGCGHVYLMSASRNLLESVAAWGSPAPKPRVFVPDDCWALRRGRAHYVLGSAEKGVPCRHLHSPQPAASVCIPMVAQGETVGVLHLQTSPLAAAGTLTGPMRHFAQSVADGVALALANLKLRETLRQQSIRDPLTGLFNRRYLEESLERELRRAARNQYPVGAAMLDLDHFKAFNDRYGHAAGDALLREFGKFLKANVRGGDIACRYGGEEFLLLLPEATVEETRERAEQIRTAMRNLQVTHGGVLEPVTLSAGVAVFPQHGAFHEALLRAADLALYEAKRSGRDRVVVHEGAAPGHKPETRLA